MSKGSEVPDVDPSALIDEQSRQNRISQFTPEGNLIFGEIGADGNFIPSTGDGQSAALIEESPFQSFFRGGTEDIMATLLGTAAPRVQNLPLAPFDPTSLPSRIGSLDFSQIDAAPRIGDFAEQGASLERATFDRVRGLLDPVFNQQEERLGASLSNRGLPTGSQIRTEEFDDFGRRRSDAFENAALSSVAAGRGEQSRLFGQAQAARAQQIADQLQQAQLTNAGRASAIQEGQSLRSNELAEIFALLQGGGINPVGVGNFFSPAGIDVLGPNNLAQNAGIANQQSGGGLTDGLLGLGGAILGGPLGGAIGGLFG